MSSHANKDGTIDPNTELNPTLPDTDGDGLWDGAEPFPFTDTSDSLTVINGLDPDSNDNGASDQVDTFVILRTNAVSSAYGTNGVWVAVDTTVNLLGADGNPDLSYTNARYDWSATLTQLPTGTATVFIYFGSGATDAPMALKTPEGWAAYFKSGTPNKIYIVKDETVTWEFSKCSSNCGTGYEPSNKAQQSYTAAHQESYEWRKALNADSDFDGLENSVETAAGTNPNVADSDGDGVPDGLEPGWNLNTDLDGKKNALDQDSDNDGVADGVEDANHDGYRQANETDVLVPDTDVDALQDGTGKGITFATDTADTCESTGDPGCGSAWLFKQDTDTSKATNALDQDSDDDGLCDGTCSGFSEDADADGLKDTGETDAAVADSDGDGIQDGTEKGLVTPLKDTDVTKFAPDKDPASVTDPTTAQTLDDGSSSDGVADGVEDKNKNGRVDLGETNPKALDTDQDGLDDGKEDLNFNGIQEKEADGTLLETGPLSKDSDVDGRLDGDEDADKDGVVDTGETDPKNPDSDADGLRDGQEFAGWRVGIWYERTMEKKTDYQVYSNPLLVDSETSPDGVSDFSEFLNGSDPTKRDTDGDGIEDDDEIAQHWNVTGIEGSPPQVTDLHLDIAIEWEKVLGLLPLPIKSTVKVSFHISDNVGIDRVQVRLSRVVGNETHTVQIAADAKGADVSETFGFSLVEGVLTGADLNITAYDVNGNGAWGQFHVDSVAEAVVKTIVAVFAPIAKVVVEAASALAQFMMEFVKAALMPLFSPLIDAISKFGALLAQLMAEIANGLIAESRTHCPTCSYADEARDHTVAFVTEFLVLFVLPIVFVLVVATKGFMIANPVFGVIIMGVAIAVLVGVFAGGAFINWEQNGKPNNPSDASNLGTPVQVGADFMAFYGFVDAVIQAIWGFLSTQAPTSAVTPSVAGNPLKWLFKTDMGGLALATLGLIVSTFVGRTTYTKGDQIISFLALALTTVGMLVTLINRDPDDGGPLNTAWWMEEVVGVVDFSLSAGGFIFDSAFMHP